MSNKNIKTFKCEIEGCIFDSENWKIYSGNPIDSQKENKDIFDIDIEKPKGFKYNKYDNITLVGNLPRIELFARQRFDGWDAFGNELSDTIQKGLVK